MRILLALVLFAHGVAHLPGFVVSWRLASFAELPYRTTVFAGRLDLGDAGIRAMGLMWLALAVAFVVAAGGLLLEAPWWRIVARAAIAVSLLVCMAALPETRIGVLANVALAAWLVWS